MERFNDYFSFVTTLLLQVRKWFFSVSNIVKYSKQNQNLYGRENCLVIVYVSAFLYILI